MRSWFALACLLLVPLPSLAGPQDPWTVDPKASAITFSVPQVGSIVSGRFPSLAYVGAASAARSCSIRARSPRRVSTSKSTLDPSQPTTATSIR